MEEMEEAVAQPMASDNFGVEQVTENDGGFVARKLVSVRRALSWALPHLFLLALVCAFIALTAFSMQWAEGANELEQSAKLRAQIEHVHAEFVALTGQNQSLEIRIRALEVQLLGLGWANGRAGVPLPAKEPTAKVWTVHNSALFATSLIARIGYGHMVPLTPLGKVLSQLFAFVGITLFLVVIADLGKFYGLLVEQLRSKLRSLLRSLTPKARVHDSDAAHDDDSDDYYVASCRAHALACGLCCAAWTALFRQLESWRWLDAAFFVLSSFMGIGFGDLVPSSVLSTWITIGAIFVGLMQMSLFIDLAGTEYITKLHRWNNRIRRIVRRLLT